MDAEEPLELSKSASAEPGLTVEFPQEPFQEDSDIDLKTGEVGIPTPWCESLKFTYKARSVLEDH